MALRPAIKPAVSLFAILIVLAIAAPFVTLIADLGLWHHILGVVPTMTNPHHSLSIGPRILNYQHRLGTVPNVKNPFH
jgi:hypothetical protein